MQKILSIEDVIRNFKPNMRVLLHAGPSESMVLQQALRAHPESAAGVTFSGLFIPQINRFDYGSLTPSTRIESLFVPPVARATFEAGRLDLLPIHYSTYPGYLRRNPVDLALLRLPPACGGFFSCGLTADIAEGAQQFARRIIVLIDPRMPYTHGGAALAAEDVEAILEVDEPPPLEATAIGCSQDRLAEQAAALINDEDTVQIGIGRLQGEVLRRLADRRRLRFYSGMITEEVAQLFEAGAIADPRRDGAPPIITGIANGGARLRGLARRADVGFHGIEVTHDGRRLAQIKNFVALNSAIEVDLFGQVNCETLGERQISGLGGSVDFARGARASSGGRSIVALASRSGETARIVPKLSSALVSLGRADIDILVTEYGSVRLGDLNLDARAQAIMALAHPSDRPNLARAWDGLRARM